MCTDSVSTADAVRDATVPADVLVLSARVTRDDLRARFIQRNRDDYDRILSMRRAYDLDATSEVDGMPLRDWLRAEMRLSGGDATRHLWLMYHLQEFGLVEEAFAAGRITIEHAYVLLRSLRLLPCDVRDILEAQLLEIAEMDSPVEVTRFVERLLEALGHDKDSDVVREQRQSSRHVRVVDSLHRTGDLRGLLMPETRVKLVTALARASAKTDSDDDRTPAQRAHDALDEILDVYLAHTDEPSFTGAPRSVLVIVPLEVLEQRVTEARATLLPTKAQIGPDTARRLACDAEVIPAVLGSHSEVLDLGRASRHFNATIRRAAWLEQQGSCAFPKCSKTPRECHHVVWWSVGGRTNLDNAAWLCPYHHWLVHEGRWRLRKHADHSFTWTSPAGEERLRHLSAA